MSVDKLHTAKIETGLPLESIQWADLPPSLTIFHGTDDNKSDEYDENVETQQQHLQNVEDRLEQKQLQCEAFAYAIVALNFPDGTL